MDYEFYRKNRLQCVYVIENLDLKRVKIGISDNMKARMSALVGASGCNLVVRYTTPFIRKAKQLEHLAHNVFKDKRLIGEWFDVDYKDVIGFLNKNLCFYIEKDEIDFNEKVENNKIKGFPNQRRHKFYGSWVELDKLRKERFLTQKESIVTLSVLVDDSTNEKNLKKQEEKVNHAAKRKAKPCKIKPDYVIGETILLDKPITCFKRVNRHLYKDNKDRLFDIRYTNKQWIMKRIS